MEEWANDGLFTASIDGSMAYAILCLQEGADVNFNRSRTGSRTTPLFNAACMGHLDMVELLLYKGASVVQRIGLKESYSPLHGAAANAKNDVVEVLVRHGATVDIRDGYQMTPMMHACCHGHAGIVRQLIEFGARVDLIDMNNISSLDICKMRTGLSEREKTEREDCMKLIQEALEKKQLRCCNPECGKPGCRSILKKCGQCKLTRYCSKDCQRQHWSVGHKKCCGHDGYSGPAPNHEPRIGMMLDAMEVLSEKLEAICE